MCIWYLLFIVTEPIRRFNQTLLDSHVLCEIKKSVLTVRKTQYLHLLDTAKGTNDLYDI